MAAKWCDWTGRWLYWRTGGEYCMFWTLTRCYRIIFGGFSRAERLWGTFNPNATQQAVVLTEKQHHMGQGIHKTQIPLRQSRIPGHDGGGRVDSFTLWHSHYHQNVSTLLGKQAKRMLERATKWCYHADQESQLYWAEVGVTAVQTTSTQPPEQRLSH